MITILRLKNIRLNKATFRAQPFLKNLIHNKLQSFAEIHSSKNKNLEKTDNDSIVGTANQSIDEGKIEALSEFMKNFSKVVKVKPGKLEAISQEEQEIKSKRQTEERRRLEKYFEKMGGLANLTKKQEEMEKKCLDQAKQRYMTKLEELMEVGRGANLKPIQRHMLKWYTPLVEALEAEQTAVWEGQRGVDRRTVGPYLVLLSPPKIAIIVMHETVNQIMRLGNPGITLTEVILKVAEAFQAEVNFLKLKEHFKANKQFMKQFSKEGSLSVRMVNDRARIVLEDSDWPLAMKGKLGSMIVHKLFEVALIDDESEGGRPAFIHEVVYNSMTKKRQGKIWMDDELYSEIVRKVTSHPVPRFLPMLVPPRPWKCYDQGGYIHLRTKVMRTRGNNQQIDALKQHKPHKVYHALDCLGSTAWKINTTVYEAAKHAWDHDLQIGDLPPMNNHEIPPLDNDILNDPEKIKEYRYHVRQLKKKNNELHSLRCDKSIKFNIADMLLHHSFYYPFSLDFRGRAYPVPPNLNNIGEDLCKGLLQFATPKPLGKRGLRWLKIHVANLFGENKICHDDRVAFTEANMDKVFDSATRPLDGDRWWTTADDGCFQALAAISDLHAALTSPDPEAFESFLPIQQDGSCNGLQHYAALGRDLAGGAQVNLVPNPKPQDVYAGVCAKVIQKVKDFAESPRPSPNQEIAQFLNGKITRKVIKQTVMTSVYGVTAYGARQQIMNQLEDIFTQDGKHILTAQEEGQLRKSAAFLAEVTMASIGEVFQEAKRIMDWLAECAHLVGIEGQPMSWVTPLGLPVVQPYRKNNRYVVETIMQNVQFVINDEELPVSERRQKTAFPPNYVHSLDSTHMMMTATRMKSLNLAFGAVHDSYWTHACDVDTMNKVLRECFYELYSSPVLETLHRSLEKRYPSINFPPVPERGDLDLQSVLECEYFFA